MGWLPLVPPLAGHKWLSGNYPTARPQPSYLEALVKPYIVTTLAIIDLNYINHWAKRKAGHIHPWLWPAHGEVPITPIIFSQLFS